MAQLDVIYRINDTNLDLRRRFLRLEERDRKVLKRLAGWADGIADRMAREFYDFQFTFAPTREFFEAFARARRMSLDDLRRHLEGAQSGYFREVFHEAARGGEYGVDYFRKRLAIGKLHNAIDLPVKWYLGSYATYMDLVRKHLRRRYPHRPRFRARAERAIFLVFNYDSQAVVDAFFYDYLESIGLDLSRITVARADHDLSDDYKALKRSVLDALTETSGMGQWLVESSQQLSAAAEQLSSSTQQQASSLEETAASIEEITATVKENTSKARRASQLALGGESGQISAVAAMDGLTKAAKRVADIIGTIDGIAFQTNLLALNAAVEAARAGEQGRGFAVVATEVRNLAQQSATASKEIRELIQEAIQRVDEGAGIVKQLADISAEVATASQQQSAGIDQISRAVTQMDQGVQANAAQTEELSSTAEALSTKAHELREVIARFKLEQGRSAESRPAAHGKSAPAGAATHPAPRAAQRHSELALVTSRHGHGNGTSAAARPGDGFEEF
jgi:methyl-accepting chemotaxis protein